jgi:hypothetical protein
MDFQSTTYPKESRMPLLPVHFKVPQNGTQMQRLQERHSVEPESGVGAAGLERETGHLHGTFT